MLTIFFFKNKDVGLSSTRKLYISFLIKILALGSLQASQPSVTQLANFNNIQVESLQKDWQLKNGNVEIKTERGNANNKLLLLQDGAQIKSLRNFKERELTFIFNAKTLYSKPLFFKFLYIDEDNYFSIGIGNQNKGIYRKVDGIETCIYKDINSKLAMPHAQKKLLDYKIYYKITDSQIVIKVDRSMDKVDFDETIVENDLNIVKKFIQGHIGFSAEHALIDDLSYSPTLVKTKLKDKRTFYVDVKRGDDKRTLNEAQSLKTPWKSINRATLIVEAGDTVLVAPGVYDEMVEFNHRGGEDSPIILKALNSNQKPTLSGLEVINQGVWEKENIKNFRGQQQTVYSARLDYKTPILFQGFKRMILAQEPNQTNQDDPYDLKLFRTLPQQKGGLKAKDPDFFKQNQKDFWKGADLLVWDSFTNGVNKFKVSSFDPNSSSISVQTKYKHKSTMVGNIEKDKGVLDKYALRNHLSLLDQPGEYYIDTSVTPNKVYVIPYEGMNVDQVAASKRPHGIYFKKGNEHIVIDGFILRAASNHGVFLESGHYVNNITIKNSTVELNASSGISGRKVFGIKAESCKFLRNYDNGVDFSNIDGLTLYKCTIAHNSDNGMWVGGGQASPWNSMNIKISDCHFYGAIGRRRHPDHYQMHQVKHILIENTIFEQEKQQNMWVQYCDDFTIRNCIFTNGPVGINSTIHSKLYNNIFWNSRIRYNRHIANHKQLKDFFQPKKALIKNNIIVNSGIDMIDEKAPVDRFKVFEVDHNFYSLENTHMQASWDYKGEELSLNKSTLLLSKNELPNKDVIVKVKVNVVWSAPSKIIFLHKDSKNYYWLGLGKHKGIYRVMNGEEVKVYDDKKNLLSVPHSNGKDIASYAFEFHSTTSTINCVITRGYKNKSDMVQFSDSETDVVSVFSNGAFGLENLDSSKHGWLRFRDFLKVTSHIETHSVDWKIIKGEVKRKSIGGARGIGFGEHSIVDHNVDHLKKYFSEYPRNEKSKIKFAYSPKSPLIGAGLVIENNSSNKVNIGNSLNLVEVIK